MIVVNEYGGIEFLRDYPHPWIFKFEPTDKIKKWWEKVKWKKQ